MPWINKTTPIPFNSEQQHLVEALSVWRCCCNKQPYPTKMSLLLDSFGPIAEAIDEIRIHETLSRGALDCNASCKRVHETTQGPFQCKITAEYVRTTCCVLVMMSVK